MEVKAITLEDDLEQLVTEVNEASWDEDNAISPYDVVALTAYLERQDTVFIACHDHSGGSPSLLGMASARIEIKPYGNQRWLYVDEVDVCANQRQRGAGKRMMEELLEIADREGCKELWLATETDNLAANRLYQSLDPDEATEIIGYAYKQNG